MPDHAPGRPSGPDGPICLLVSPRAGGGRGHGTGMRVAQRLRAAGHQVDVVDRSDAASAVAAARDRLTAAPAPAALVVVGGDGAVNVGVNCLLGSQVAPLPLGVVPAGTGNDFARTLGLPAAPEPAADAVVDCLARQSVRAVDAVRLDDGRWFVGVMSAGFDAVVSERANRLTWAPGPLRYVLATARELPSYRARRYRLDLDGEVWQVDALLVSVANTSTYGGGMRIAPAARTDDGMLDVVVVLPLPKTRLVRLFPRLYAGTHTQLPVVRIRQAKRVLVEIVDDRPALVPYADGERLTGLPATCEVSAGALQVLAPPATTAPTTAP